MRVTTMAQRLLIHPLQPCYTIMQSSHAINLLDTPLIIEELERPRTKRPWSFLLRLLGEETPPTPRASSVESPLSAPFSADAFHRSSVDRQPAAQGKTAASPLDEAAPVAEPMALDPATELALERARSLAGRAQIAAILLNSKKDNEGRDSLHTAARLGGKELAELLVESGADVQSTDDTGRSPLHYAALCGSRDVAEILLANRVDANARNDFGGTPLHGAVLFGSKDVVELLLAHHADINAADNFGQTPLHAAARRGSLDMLNLLLAHKADVNAKDKHGNCPLQDAVLCRNRDAVEFLRAYRGGE